MEIWPERGHCLKGCSRLQEASGWAHPTSMRIFSLGMEYRCSACIAYSLAFWRNKLGTGDRVPHGGGESSGGEGLPS